MKSIAFHLQKGGVGKTSLSCSIAYEFSKKGRTVLLDLDPQGNSSSWLLTEAPNHELAHILFGKVKIDQAIISTKTKDLDIIPTFGIGGDLKTYGENQLANEPFIFVDLIDGLAALGYDYVVMDLSPGMGRLERFALIAVDEVITPMTPEAFSLDGIEIFTTELEKTTKAMKRGPVHKRIIVNALDKRIDQHMTIYKQAQKFKRFELFTIGVDPAFRKAQAANKPVQALTKKEKAKDNTLESLKSIGGALCL